jgi:hypothetical protein
VHIFSKKNIPMHKKKHTHAAVCMGESMCHT